MVCKLVIWCILMEMKRLKVILNDELSWEFLHSSITDTPKFSPASSHELSIWPPFLMSFPAPHLSLFKFHQSIK